MKLLEKTKAPSRWGPAPEQLLPVKDAIARTHGNELTPKFDRLDNDEQLEIVALFNTMAVDDATARWPDPSVLTKRELARWQKLVEKAADKPKFFRTQAERAKTRTELLELAKRARVPTPRPRWEAPAGSIVLTRENFFELLTLPDGGTAMQVEDIGLCVFLLGMLGNDALDDVGGRLEIIDGERTLIIDAQAGLGSVYWDDPEYGIVTAWKRLLACLEDCGWFKVDRNGREWRIAPGPRGRRALGLGEKT